MRKKSLETSEPNDGKETATGDMGHDDWFILQNSLAMFHEPLLATSVAGNAIIPDFIV